MSGSFPSTQRRPSGYRVRPHSTDTIRQCAVACRNSFALDEGKIAGERFIDLLTEQNIFVDIVEDDEIPAGEEARCIPDEDLIVLPMRTYKDLVAQKPRALFTLAHELGHWALRHRVIMSRGNQQHKFFEDSEWQANQFAAEFLMPLNVIRSKNLRSAKEIMSAFGVSYDAASKRLKSLKEKNEL